MPENITNEILKLIFKIIENDVISSLKLTDTDDIKRYTLREFEWLYSKYKEGKL